MYMIRMQTDLSMQTESEHSLGSY